MSEQHHGRNDKIEKLNPVETQSNNEKSVESEYSVEQNEQARHDTLETTRDQIDQLAESSESVKVGEDIKEPVNQVGVDRELKDLAYSRILTRTRKRLPLADKWLSKAIHQPVVDKLSQAGEKTIARPSGVLGGSLFALVGSSTLLYTAKHYGFRYNFLAFFLMFILGFGFGLLAELALFAFRKSRH
jgi:hypothetical protein